MTNQDHQTVGATNRHQQIVCKALDPIYIFNAEWNTKCRVGNRKMVEIGKIGDYINVGFTTNFNS